MSIVVNTNVSATTASLNLSRANDSRRKSLARLSSGNRIVSSADDAGGFAEAYKLPSSVKRVEAVRNNVEDGVSYLQAQDGVPQVAGNVLDRMVELRTLVQYETKDTKNVENHFKEFLEVQRQFRHIYYEKCDGISLSAISLAKAAGATTDGAGGGSTTPAPSGAALRKVSISGKVLILSKTTIQTEGDNWRNSIQDDMPGTTGGLPSLGIGPNAKDPLLTLFTINLPDNVTYYDYDFLETCAPDHLQVSLYASASAGTKFAPYLGFSGNDVFATPAGSPGVQDAWDVKAENGAEKSRLNMSSELLAHKQTNLKATHNRIIDADMALESTRFARRKMLVQARVAMTVQANQLTNAVLTLLG